MKKKRLKEQKRDKKTINLNIAMSILLVVVLSFISIGYALYNQILNSNGNVTFNPQGTVRITNVELLSSINVKDGSIPTFTDDSINFNLTFEKAEETQNEPYQAIYEITIKNDTFYDFTFNIENFQPIIKNSSGITVNQEFLTTTLDGINMGDSIPAGEEVKFTVKFDFAPDTDDTYTVDGEMNTDLKEEPHGSLLGNIPGNTQGDLRESEGNDLAEFTVTVINTYQSPREFSINITDTNHFEIVNSQGQPLGNYTIQGGETNTYNFYVKRKDNAIFASSSFTAGIYLSHTDESNVNCGTVTLLVDEEEVDDTTPPLVSNVQATINNATSDNTSDNNVGSVTVTWDGEDAESGVKKYYVIVTSAAGTNTYETENSNPSLTITGLADGNYQFKVYGENNHGYKPTDAQITNPSSSNGTVAESISYSFKWHYTVSLSSNSQYVKALSNTKVNRGYNYTTTLSANDEDNSYTYSLPTSITVNMDGTNISTGTSAGHYNYTRSSGNLTIYGVTGDTALTVRGTRTQKGGGGCIG